MAEAVSTRPRFGAVVLAAGAARRFGGDKLLASLRGRPLLQHVLDTLAVSDLALTVVVLPPTEESVPWPLEWHGAHRITNPDPQRGLASSLQVGVEAAAAFRPTLAGIFVALGDQPGIRGAVLTALAQASGSAAGASIIVPRYADGGGANPALLLPAAWPLAATLSGDRGMGPLIAARPDLVLAVPVAGGNPDVDTPADLERMRSEPASADSG